MTDDHPSSEVKISTVPRDPDPVAESEDLIIYTEDLRIPELGLGCQMMLEGGRKCKNRLHLKSKCRLHYEKYRLDVKPQECPICFEKLVVKDKPLSCGHYCHRGCLTKWLSSQDHKVFVSMGPRCPVCKRKIALNKAELDRIERGSLLSRGVIPSVGGRSGIFPSSAMLEMVASALELRPFQVAERDNVSQRAGRRSSGQQVRSDISVVDNIFSILSSALTGSDYFPLALIEMNGTPFSADVGSEYQVASSNRPSVNRRVVL